jgi:hypothetical protein
MGLDRLSPSLSGQIWEPSVSLTIRKPSIILKFH